MALTRLEILDRRPYEEGRAYGKSGPYERIEAVAHYAVDPEHPANAGIVDLERAERGEDGLVHFRGDASLLVPADPSKANRALLVEVPNRGNRVAFRSFNRAPFDLLPTTRIDPGDGFLLEQGWSVAWCGWQWDVPDTPERLKFTPPSVPPGRIDGQAQMQLRLQPHRGSPHLPVTDQHVGPIGNHRRIPPADPDDPGSVLWVRDRLYETPQRIPRERWRFARETEGEVVADHEHVWLEGGFEAGRIYDLVYRPRYCPVVGAGLLAVRDFAAHLRRDIAAPTAGCADQVIGEGLSQCGRFLRTFLHLGLNLDEDGEPVFDGLLVHVAGGRRGEFNHRYGQPSVQPTPSFGHLFPFADAPQTDPRTGRTAGLLDRQRARGGLPRVVYTDTSSEYWRGDAGLTHIDAGSVSDVEPPAEVRRYLFAGTQHGPGLVPLARDTMFGSRGANLLNVVDYRPLFRAALVNLLAWVRDGVEPPPSVFPRLANGTAAFRDAVVEALGAIPDLDLPSLDALPAIFPLDLGPAADRGIGLYPARIAGDAYPVLVSAVDADGNETGGIRMPDVSVPIATHTGFNPRHRETGAAGQILEYVGSTVPFALTEAERRSRRDPRASVAARYPGRAAYLERVAEAARGLVAQRLLLESDVEVCVAIAAERYDACMGARPEKALSPRGG